MIDYNRDAHIFPEMRNDKFSYYRQMAFEAWGGDDYVKPRYPKPKEEEPDHSYVKGEIPEKKTLDVYDVIYTGKIVEVRSAYGRGLLCIEATTMQNNQEESPTKKKIKPTKVNVHLSWDDGVRIRPTVYGSVEEYDWADRRKFDFFAGDYAEVHLRRTYAKGIFEKIDASAAAETEDKVKLTLQNEKKRAVFSGYGADVDGETPKERPSCFYDVTYSGKITDIFPLPSHGVWVRIAATTMKDNQEKSPAKKKIKPTEVTVIMRAKDGYEMCDEHGVKTGDYAEARFRYTCTKGICKNFAHDDLGKIENKTTISVRKGRKKVSYEAC